MTDTQISVPAGNMKARVKAARTSFAVGMMLLPRARREAMYALYAFCREVDDIADDGANETARLAGLQMWRQFIRDLFAGKASDPITAALLPAIAQFRLAEEDFQAIIDGMTMDAGSPICAPSMTQLDLYCDRVASAVGRVSVRIFGDSSPDALRVAHHLGRALQLTNILRDLSEDAARGRLYLPRELLQKHNITATEPAEILRDKNLNLVCRDLADMAIVHFRQAATALRECSYGPMRPARIMGGFYRAILDRLIETDWQDITQRVRLSRWQKLMIVLRCF